MIQLRLKHPWFEIMEVIFSINRVDLVHGRKCVKRSRITGPR